LQVGVMNHSLTVVQGAMRCSSHDKPAEVGQFLDGGSRLGRHLDTKVPRLHGRGMDCINPCLLECSRSMKWGYLPLLGRQDPESSGMNPGGHTRRAIRLSGLATLIGMTRDKLGGLATLLVRVPLLEE